MPASAKELVAIRRYVGSQPDDDTLNDYWDGAGEASVEKVARIVLETRRADLGLLMAMPKVSVSSDASVDSHVSPEVLKDLTRRIDELTDVIGDGPLDPGGVTFGQMVRVGRGR